MDTPETSDWDRARDLFDEHLQGAQEGAEKRFESLCREHPQLEEILRRIREMHAAIQAFLQPSFGGSEEPCVPEAQPHSSLQRIVSDLERRPRAEARYEVGEEIARGGMGRVLRVWDANLARPLVMKVARSRTSANHPSSHSRPVRRFLEEARITARLDHPGIPPVHELVLDAAGNPAFTMKLVRGEDLRAALKKVKAKEHGWNTHRCVSVLLRISEAIAYAHSRGVIHRDLKPANVMLGPFGEVYVMDWGLARARGKNAGTDDLDPTGTGTPRSVPLDPADSALLTREGDVLGTPAYMSPEQACGELDVVDERSDIYSLGAILYEILAGRMPYASEDGRGSSHTMLARVIQGPPEPLEGIAPDSPSELRAVCEKAMARERAKRYTTTAEFASDLQDYLEGRVVRALESGPFAELRKWVRRNRALATALTAALVITVSGFISVTCTRQVAAAERARRVGEENFRKMEEELRLEAVFEHELRLLADIETTGDKRKQLDEYSASCLGIAALFAARDLPLDGSRPADELARSINGTASEYREQLVDGLYLLAKQVVLSGLARANHHSRHGGEPPGTTRERWRKMVEGHRPVMVLWPNVRQVLRALGDQRYGPDAIDAWTAYSSDRSALFDLPEDWLESANPSEVELIALIANHLGKPAQELRATELGIAKYPNRCWLHYRRARLAYFQDDKQNLLLHAMIAHALWPGSINFRSILAIAHEELEHMDKAIEMNRSILRDDPEHFETLFNLSALLFNVGVNDEPIQLLEQARQVRPSDRDVWKLLGEAYQRRALEEGDASSWRHAAEVYAGLVTLEPESWEGHYLWGRALQSSGDYEAAIERFEASLDLDPSQPDPRAALEDSRRSLEVTRR